MYGSTDDSGSEPVLETWLRQRGKQLYNTDGTLAYDEADVTDWFQMWADMRAAGAVPPADVQALDHGDVDTSLLAQSRAALAFANSNQYVAYSSLTQDELGMAPYPKVGPDGKGGLYIKPSQFFSVSSQSKLPDASVELINFLLTDPGATEILGGERGIPSSAAVREQLRPKLDHAGELMIDYISNLGELAGPLPPPNPPGGGEVTNELMKASQEVAFGASSPADGAKSYMTAARDVLANA
jgi:multiple sugar transport system substrate-binding protein